MKAFKKFLAFVLVVATVVGGIVLPSGDVNVNAASEMYRQKLRDMGFPESYVEPLAKLHYLHPSWNFVPLIVKNTYAPSSGTYNWDYVINGEDAKWGSTYRNLISSGSSYSAYRDSSITGTYDSGWYKASKSALKYFMDPRNFLNENDIFMFESLSFSDSFTVDNVATAIAGTFMDGKLCDNGLSYAQTIYNAAKANNLNPMFLASRLKQENGTGNSQLVKGNSGYTLYKWYTERTELSAAGKQVWGGAYDNTTFTESQLMALNGYYNLFNIGAGGNGVFAIIYNGALHAKNQGWSTHALSIEGGAAALAKNYINKHQDTIYLQKFNVDGNSPYGLFAHQYMQNVAAPLSEGRSTRKTYYTEGFLDYAHTFEIPVYADMPSSPCADPAGGSSSYSPRANSEKALNAAEVVFDSISATNWLIEGPVSSYVGVNHKSISTANGYDSFARITSPTSGNSTSPYITFNYANFSNKISASSYKYVTIVARSYTSGTATFMPYAGSVTAPTSSCQTTFSVIGDGLWHEYVIDLSGLSSYTGTLNGVRFHFFTGTVAAGTSFDLRSIRYSTTKPATVSLTASSNNYTSDAGISLSYSGLSSHINTSEDYRPFIGIYEANGGPGKTAALQWAYLVKNDSGTLVFPSAAQGGTNTGTLPSGQYVAYLCFDSYGVMREYSLSNGIYSGNSSVTFSITNTESPIGNLENVSGNPGAVSVGGWAYDSDVPSQSIEIHVYIGGTAGTAGTEFHKVTADYPRSDVNSAFGITGNHGFEGYFSTNLRGEQPVHIYAIDANGSSNTYLGMEMVTISEPLNNVIKLDTAPVSQKEAIYLGNNVTASNLIAELKEKMEVGSKVTLTAPDGSTLADSAVVGTGVSVSIDNNTYSIIVQGDVDGNGSVDITDATLVLQHIKGQYSLTAEQSDAVLFDSSRNTINILDVVELINLI